MGHRRGVTLIELMVVLSVIAIVFGIGLAFLTSASRDLEFRSTVGQVRTLLRYARSEAIAQHSAAYVEIDPVAREMRAVTKRPIGLWHFEDDACTGAFGHHGKVSGGELVRGKLGSALSLGRKNSVDCGELPLFRPDQGILIEAWLLLNSAEAQSLFTCEGMYGLRVAKDGGLAGEAGGKETDAEGVRVPVGRWFEAKLVYDGKIVLLKQDGQVVGASEDDGKAGELVDRGAHFFIGGGDLGMDGLVDEVRVSAILPTETRHLPEGISIEGDAPVQVWFDERGRLDRGHHSGPVQIVLHWEKESETFTIGWLGTVQSASGEPLEEEAAAGGPSKESSGEGKAEANDGK